MTESYIMYLIELTLNRKHHIYKTWGDEQGIGLSPFSLTFPSRPLVFLLPSWSSARFARAKFSSLSLPPFWVHLGRRLKCTRCPSSARPSLTFHIFWKRWTEFNETWQEASTQHPLQSLCFSGQSEKQDGRPGLWFAETFSTSPLKPLKGIQRNLTGSKISTSST